MKIVISGGTDIGLKFAKALSAENDLYVIESDPERIQQLESLDLQIIKGNPTSLTSLEETDIYTAEAFIACHQSDETNILSCLAVKQLCLARTFCFVNKAHYFETFDGELGERLMIDHLLWPEMLLGEYIADIIRVPGAIDVKVFDREDLKFLEFLIVDDNQLINKPLKSIKIPKGALAVAIFRGDEVIIPSGNTMLQPDDKVVFMGHGNAMKKVENLFNPLVSKKFHIAVVGGGDIGSVLIKALAPYSNIKIRLIEKSLKTCQALAETFGERILVLNSDGTDFDTMREAHIEQCDCLVALTGSDERNLIVSLRAKSMGVRKVITRVYDIENIEFFEKLGVDIALSARHNAVQGVVRKLSDDSINIFAIFEKGKATIIEIVVPKSFTPTKLMDLEIPPGAIIAAARRGGRTIVPSGSDKIKPNDRLRVFQTSDNEGAIRSIFKQRTDKNEA